MATTLAATYGAFLGDAQHLDRLRPATLRAYRYGLAAAAAHETFQASLDTLTLTALFAHALLSNLCASVSLWFSSCRTYSHS